MNVLAVKAYYSKGHFVPEKLTHLPEGTKAIVTIIDESAGADICDFGFAHDYSALTPSPESEYRTFETWAKAKEWLRV